MWEGLIMVKMSEAIKKIKPKFIRSDWHKKIKLGSTVKKNRKWRAGKGRHNKIRLNRKGYSVRPRVGWGADARIRDLVNGLEVVRVENVEGLENVGKGAGVMIGRVGKKKREEILKKAKEMKVEVLNRYRSKKTEKILKKAEEEKDATS
jgi:ribosomal protein L32E